MLTTNYIRCHGSGNRFLMLDAVAEPQLEGLAERPHLIARLCTERERMDGLLLTVRVGEAFGMRMFNTDGSEAEMCGNGIRCVARQAQHYVGEACDRFDLWSGGRIQHIRRDRPIYGTIPTYRVDIAIRTASAEFPQSLQTGEWIGRVVPELDAELRFTYLNLGNPHLVAEVEEIDLERLTALGERVKELTELLPRGVNVSLFRHTGEQAIYTATYERGVGLTSSCGTAMTACSTASCLLGLNRTGQPIEVRNSGGKVDCCCRHEGTEITTSLSGNATYEAEGELSIDLATEQCRWGDERPCTEEVKEYEQFYNSLK